MPRLTQPTIDKYKPDPNGKVRTIPDTGQPGLYLLVHPSGRKSWVVMYRRRDGKQRKLTLPSPFVSLATAHKLTRAAIDKVAEGGDPAAEKQLEKRSAASAELVADAFRLFVENTKGRAIRETTRVERARVLGFKRDKEGKWVESESGVLAYWKGRKLRDITKADVIKLLDSVQRDAKTRDPKTGKGGEMMANRTLTALKTCFKYLVEEVELIEKSPCASVRPPADEKARETVLTDDELAAVWRAAEAAGSFGRMVQLLILTGCRRDEAREVTRGEIDLTKREWRIPGKRTKNGRNHLVPLSDFAVAMLRKLPTIQDNSGNRLVFTSNGEAPIAGLSRLKERLNAAVAAELGAKPQDWTLHDLRRTLTTGLQRLRFPIEVTEAVLNHKGGRVSGVAAIYAQHDYAEEKREALTAWAAHVASLIDDKSSASVIPFETRRA